MSASTSYQAASAEFDRPASSIHYEQRRAGHICAIIVRNLSLRPTRDRALQTLTSKRPGGSSRYHTTSDDADLTRSLARSNSKGKAKADGSYRRRRSSSWTRSSLGSSDDEDTDYLATGSASTSTPSKPHFGSRSKPERSVSYGRPDNRGRSALLAGQRRTSDHELSTASALHARSDGTPTNDTGPRPILKRSSSTRDGREARQQTGSPSSSSASGFLDELGANTTMLSRSDSRSSSHSSHTIRRPTHRPRTTSMTSSASIRSVRFDESHAEPSEEARRPSRRTGRLNSASRYALFSQKSLSQIMKDRMLQCYVELSFDSAEAAGSEQRPSNSAEIVAESVFYRTPNSKPGLHHSWGYQGGDPITPERDFATSIQSTTPLETSTISIKVWARSPSTDIDSSGTLDITDGKEENWKLVCQTRVDLRDLKPVPGNLQDAGLALPPNSILLGLASGANSLSGRASMAAAEVGADPGVDGTSSNAGKKGEPKLERKVSEREAERTRHILESITYYVVPLQAAGQGKKSHGRAEAAGLASGNRHRQSLDQDAVSQRDGSSNRPPIFPRRVSGEGYASDPEHAPNRKTAFDATSAKSVTEQAATASSPSSTKAVLPLTPEARRQRRKAFEDEQRRVLELSLRETKMMPSYDLEEARKLAAKQAKLHSLVTEVEEMRHINGDVLQDPTSFVQLRLKREQQKAKYEAVRQLAIDEAEDLQRRRAELEARKSALEARRDAIRATETLFKAANDRSRRIGHEVDLLKGEKADLSLNVHAQQASLLRDLEIIFPIELSDASSLLFSICGLPLPNAVASLPQVELVHEEKRWKDTVKRHVPASTRPVFHHFDDDTVSSAFGMVAQLVVLLSTYLATPIHYPLATAGSRAVVQDGISLMSGPRAFPLYAKGMERYRYEYAAFLLNKDIEQLMNVHSVTVIDIRHTLPNIKNLMVTVAAAPPTSHLTRKSHIGKNEIALRSAVSNVSLSAASHEDAAAAASGTRAKAGLGLGLGLPSLTAAAAAGNVKTEGHPILW